MKISLDFKGLETPAAVHAYLQQALAFPAYYGKNLDALYDVLSTWDQPACFILRLPERSGGEMAAFWPRLGRVFMDAAAANPRVEARIR